MRLKWNNIGERFFETGVDQGVLYIDNAAGVPWNGLVSVSESPSGATLSELYIDGIKYLQLLEAEEYAATIEAYTYPDEFGACDGTRPVGNGLFMTHQPRKSFSLSYRTKIGNDVNGIDLGYKIHLVYDALAAPTQRQNNSLSDSVDPFHFNWSIAAKPPSFAGYKPTAHMVIDSRDTPTDLLAQIEDILYGSEASVARLPSVDELIFLFNSYQAMVFDAGYLTEEYFNGFDAGAVSDPQTALIDGGMP